MADLPTRLDIYAIGRQYLLSKATKIEPTMVDVQGSDANLFVGSTSVMVDVVTKQLGYSINRTYLDGAEGDDLDRWAYDRYQETRKGASAAVGSVRFYRATLTGGDGSIPIGTVLKSLLGTEYITTTIASFGVNSYTAFASVRASQAGKATEVGENQITKFSNPGSAFDPTIQVNNDSTTAGGEDAEDDDTFKLRLRNFWLTARRGVLSAIVQGATSVSGVVSAEAVEALSSTGQPARLVNLYIADSSGVASQELANSVYAALNDYRAGGIPVIISTSIPLIISIALALEFQAGVDSATLTTQIKSSLYEFVNSLGVNQTLYLADIYTVLNRFKQVGVIISSSSVQNPTGDLVPAVGQTLRIFLHGITVNGS
jgi:uncharacterized phage protein gp47/JayE